MKYAISMYLAGTIVKAQDCDYDSYRDLGLKCPYCAEAVFLRRGTLRDRRGRTEIIQPAFAHYPGNPWGDDCELRSRTPDGQDYVRKIQIEQQQQRLKLYNDRLWDLIARDRNISRHMLLTCRKWVGQRRVSQEAILARKLWRDRVATGEVYRYIDAVFDAALNGQAEREVDLIREHILAMPGSRRERQQEADIREAESNKQLQWMHGADRALHHTLCTEVADFLATRTAGYALEKIATSMVAIANFDRLISYPEEFNAALIVELMPGYLVGTHWRDQVAHFLSDEAIAPHEKN